MARPIVVATKSHRNAKKTQESRPETGNTNLKKGGSAKNTRYETGGNTESDSAGSTGHGAYGKHKP
jgi:hypothetical protein